MATTNKLERKRAAERVQQLQVRTVTTVMTLYEILLYEIYDMCLKGDMHITQLQNIRQDLGKCRNQPDLLKVMKPRHRKLQQPM